ncbi:uncharacterized protein LOC119969297 isoform X2 [Scyliorhinus canicula]|uniref:uncharacterized protein LOC119969297 isoform X2 n=1 Tax=Scyliorhinus canicula TaxID=7830 RepID=UPI0018F49F1C|nr:uncharacterized protein LOC119969297 isoform X2 [Scyliorhinus canicula]
MKISSCNVKMQIWHSGSVVAETRSHSQGSEAVCRGEINIPSSLIGDFVIKGIPPPYYEYNGNGKFQIREQAYREEKEKDAILHIIVNLTKTKRFFIPGAPFRIWVCVTYPDRSPVSEALIKVGITSEDKYINVSKEVFTDDIGELGISFNVPENASKLHIKVSTRNKALETEESSEIVIESLAHNKAYLSIELPNVLLYPGDIIYVTLSAFSQLNINDVNYYYYMFQIQPALDTDHAQRDLLLSVFSDNVSDVFIQAVDSQLYGPNKDDTLQKVFYAKDFYDFGTSYGGGIDTTEVFEGAGLRFISDLVKSTNLHETTIQWRRGPLTPPREVVGIMNTHQTIYPVYDHTWVWEIQETSGKKTYRLTSDIDSPNSWTISAFSISKEGEICIAKPMMMKMVDSIAIR